MQATGCRAASFSQSLLSPAPASLAVAGALL
jgi:hypothetical protein